MATVYKYLSPDLQECYVGSTTDEDRRKSRHKCGSNTTSELLFEKYGYDNCSYVVLEVCPLEERRIKEQWWLDHSVGAVNERKALLTEAELKAYKKTQYEANKELQKAQNKANYEAHKEEIKARMKAYREANKEQEKARNKAYRETHREQIKARMKAYREAHKAQTKIS
jgi:group I intron endonuclease